MVMLTPVVLVVGCPCPESQQYAIKNEMYSYNEMVMKMLWLEMAAIWISAPVQSWKLSPNFRDPYRNGAPPRP
eukprot:10943566-Karenia_brevis.AAC.1